MTNPFNVEKTIQKFQQLAKDAQTMGDPVLVENYLQHADHYSRRLSELNVKSKPIIENKKDNENQGDILVEKDKASNNEPALEK